MDENRKGICTNLGNCKNADSKLPIEVPITADFICPECDRELMEVIPKKTIQKKQYIIGSIVVFFLLIGAIVFFTLKSKVDKATEVIKVATSISNVSSKEENKGTIGVTKDTTAQPETKVEQPTQKPEQVPGIKKPKGGNGNSQGGSTGKKNVGTLTFSFGYYKGEILNGKMNGLGTLYFNQSQVISSKDQKQRTAEAGDNVNGTWFEGYLDQGKWFDKSGEQKEVINIGH